MDNWKAIAYLLGFWQGIILALSLILRGVRGQRGGLFLGLILVVLAQELLNAWGMQVRYHSRPDAFPFWNFQSYVVLPLALWFFVRAITEPAFIFKPKYSLFFFAGSRRNRHSLGLALALESHGWKCLFLAG